MSRKCVTLGVERARTSTRPQRTATDRAPEGPLQHQVPPLTRERWPTRLPATLILVNAFASKDCVRAKSNSKHGKRHPSAVLATRDRASARSYAPVRSG